MKRCCLALNVDHKRILIMPMNKPIESVLGFVSMLHDFAQKKFRLAKKQNLMFFTNGQYVNEMNLENIQELDDDCLIIVLRDGEYVIDNKKNRRNSVLSPIVFVDSEKQSMIDTNAILQLKKVASLEGMKLCVGMPDLHIGQKFPIGAACVSSVLYPDLVGSDIGCGMSLFETDIRDFSTRSTHKNRDWLNLKNHLQNNNEKLFSPIFLSTTLSRTLDKKDLDFVQSHDYNFATIGSGNHFAELQQVVDVFIDGILDKTKLYLLIHSGSRTLGPDILDQFCKESQQLINKHEKQQAVYKNYLNRHDIALEWASQNRHGIAKNFALQCGFSLEKKVLDVCHNFVEKNNSDDQDDIYLHRKGVAPLDKGLVAIPGSRGTMTYVVQPTSNIELRKKYANSIAHGAGRSLSRSAANKKFKYLEKVNHDSLIYHHRHQTHILSEEAPEAYKNIENIIQILIDYKLIEVVAILKPFLTKK